VELNKIPVQELILRLEDSSKAEQEENYTIGYWKGENRFVSLIPLEKNEKVSFWHPNILPIYAEVTLKAKRYVISDEYKNCSLKNLLEEFGPFEESLGKRYLKQVALGLQHMHFHRRGHNRLTVKTILYNKNGELFINAVRSTSFVPSREELLTSKELHYFAPEFLLSKGFSRSLKNDAWALGCLAILMLTSTGLTRSPLHPYNFKKFDSSSEEQMIDNLMQLHTAYFSQSIGEEQVYRASHEGKRRVLSEAALNFISSCFKILSDERASIEALLEH
jgi:serine/threonine protein kinase